MSTNVMKALLYAGLTLGLAAAAVQTEAAQPKSEDDKADPKQVQRGRYLAKVAGCNDCHTPGYAMSGGKVPESQWLTGDKLGWRGPWGTTYAINLRLYMRDMSEAQWVQRAKTMQTRPPMPWFALHDMTDQDLRALYRYVKALGPGGEPAPSYVPPDRAPQGPYVQFPAPPK
jgi:mono/diheme cytochrome c family protein